eukprot:13210621-Alexandrium_andersonii.AAC.1
MQWGPPNSERHVGRFQMQPYDADDAQAPTHQPLANSEQRSTFHMAVGFFPAAHRPFGQRVAVRGAP